MEDVVPMGTIIERPGAYIAQILLESDGKVVHRESRTLHRKAAATACIKKYKAELEKISDSLGTPSTRRESPSPPFINI